MSFQRKENRNRQKKSFTWLVIDLDHIFRRHYIGLQNHYQKTEPTKYHQGYSWEDDSKFIVELRSQIQNKVKKLISQLRINPRRVVLTTDDIQSTTTDWIWRADVWPDWSLKFNNEFYSYRQGPVWNKVFSEGLTRFFTKEGYTYFTYPDFEADDVIAVVVQSILQRNPRDQVNIITQDADFYQLISENVNVLNLDGEEDLSRCFKTGKANLWFGIIGGRMSNKVPGLRFEKEKFKKFLGDNYDKDLEELNEEDTDKYRRLYRQEQYYCIENLDNFLEWIETTPNLIEKDQHLINQRVMDFSEIPLKHVQRISKYFWNEYEGKNKKVTPTAVIPEIKTNKTKDEKQQGYKNPFAALMMEENEN